jgi:hypothetical protein
MKRKLILALCCAACRLPEPSHDAGLADAGGLLPLPEGVPVYRAPAQLPPYRELPVERVRGFNCRADQVTAETTIADVDGTTDEHVVIVPDVAPCNYQLKYRAGAALSALSETASGFLIAAAAHLADGNRVVCASEIHHHATGGGSAEIDSVPIRCWASGTTVFTGIVAVEGSSDYAAWVRTVAAHPTRAGAYVVTWARDFSFQFLNNSDLGRPSTDGEYETVLTWDGTTLSAEPTTKKSDVSNLFSGATLDRYTPAPERAALLKRLNQELP